MTRRSIPMFPLLAFVLLVGAIPSGARADATSPAVITAVTGPVGYRLPNTGAFRPAHGGESLPAGTLLRTGLHGVASLHWSNGGEFKLEPLGELDIEDPNDVRVDAGQVWARYTAKLLAPFSFHSPSATAVVRGTILGVRVDGLGITRVTVFRGKVEVSDPHGGHAWLLPGQGLNATTDQGLGPVAPLTDDDRQHNAFPPDQSAALAPAKPAKTPEAKLQKQANNLWERMDDATHGGLGWLDHNRAAERMPMLQEQLTRAPLHRTGVTRPAEIAPPVDHSAHVVTPVQEVPQPMLTPQLWTPPPQPTPAPAPHTDTSQNTHQTGQPDLAK